jgi:predicted nuclease of predicted toxin-antitoxin system
MLFKTDENLPVEVTDLLKQHGHDAISVPEQNMVGEQDTQFAQVCQKELRAMVTLDLDFCDIRTYPPEDYPGIIVLRPAVQNITSLLRLVQQVILLLGQEQLARHLWIVDDSSA